MSGLKNEMDYSKMKNVYESLVWELYLIILKNKKSLSLPSLLAYNTHFPGKFYIFSEYHSVKEAMKNIHYDKS